MLTSALTSTASSHFRVVEVDSSHSDHSLNGASSKTPHPIAFPERLHTPLASGTPAGIEMVFRPCNTTILNVKDGPVYVQECGEVYVCVGSQECGVVLCNLFREFEGWGEIMASYINPLPASCA